MQREYLILVNGEENCGAVKLEMPENILMAEINIEKKYQLEKDEVFKVYLVCPGKEKERVRYLGVPEGYRGEYALAEVQVPIGIAITRKKHDREEFFCCCAQEGRIKETEECFKKVFMGKSQEPADPEPQKANMEKEPEKEEYKPGGISFEREYQHTAFEKLEKLTKGFVSEKINGYFLKRKCKILEHIMGSDEVYRRIMRHGYYIFSIKKEEETEMYIVSVPAGKNEENPFVRCEKYVFKVESDVTDDVSFYCVAAGRDKSGEFFCKRT